jgi:release factor glutamine methyltransferase
VTDVRTLLAEAAATLTVAGVASPRTDAQLLLSFCTGVEPGRLVLLGDVSSEQVLAFRSAVQQRADRTPLQHLTGTAPFRHLMLEVGDGVFTPRPETELLVDAALPELASLAHPVVVDLCAGSGAIALSIGHEVPAAQVYAVERSPAALEYLRRNAAQSRVLVVAGDVTDPSVLDDLDGGADVVLSNPPYVPNKVEVSPEVLHDPAEAVFAGALGLDLMAAVSATAARLLRTGGLFVLEHDDTHAESVPALLHATGHWSDIVEHQDLTGRPRFVTARRR